MNAVVVQSPKRCDICRGGSNEHSELYLGPWMQKKNITVHYHCLLLSTHLPQEGEDCGGINGFLLRHIRAEIAAAGKRSCEYCNEVGASIQCNTCKIYFDINCGIRNLCLFQFVGEFHSYCRECICLDDFQKNAKSHWGMQECYICKELLSKKYLPTEHLYAPCCKNGFVHRYCMQKYALEAGYYLRCIWCRNSSFRESIKLQGIFVPDREAQWETKTRFRDLHRGHSRCDMEHCKCERGREYKSSCWNLINCNLCGSFGVHYPRCLPNYKKGNLPSIEDFRCETCASIERKTLEDTIQGNLIDNVADYFDLYICKSKQPRNDSPEKESLTQEESQLFEKLQQISNKEITLKQIKIVENNVNSTAPELLENENIAVPENSEFPSKTLCLNTTNLFDLTKTGDYVDNFEEIEIFDFTENLEMIGKCKLRIDLNSPRFAKKNIGEIMINPEIFSEEDLIERTGDIVPFVKAKYLLGGKLGEEFLSGNISKCESNNI